MSGARSALGAASLLPFAYALRSKFPRDRPTWALMAGLGILNFALPWTLFSIGQRHVPSGVGSIANSAQPLWAAIFSVALIKGDALGRTKSFGLLLGFAGVVVLMPGRIRGLDSESLQGIPPMILATVLYGISAVSIRKWLRHVPAVQLTFVQIGVAGCLLLPIALATGAYDNASMGWHGGRVC